MRTPDSTIVFERLRARVNKLARAFEERGEAIIDDEQMMIQQRQEMSLASRDLDRARRLRCAEKAKQR